MNRLSAAVVTSLLSLLCAGVHAAPAVQAQERLNAKDIQLATYAKALIGEGNVTVEIAHYKKGKDEGAILLFKGIEGPWDGKAINHRVRTGTYGRKEYVTSYQDSEWNTLYVRKSQDGKLSYEMFIPENADALSLAPSDGAAQLTTPQAIFEEYQKQAGMKGPAK